MEHWQVDGTVALTTNGSGNATVVNDAGLNLAASTVRGNLAATATTGNITDSGNLAVTGTSSLTTSANNATITLNNTNAFAGAVTITTNDDSGTDADVILDNGTTALILAASTIDGDLTLTSGHASGITDSGTVTVGGKLVATTNDNSGVINLDSLAVDAGIHLRTHGTGDATAVNDAGFGFGVGGSTVGGNLIATATTGNMWDYGSLTVGRTTTLTTSANNATIKLNNTNAFAGAVTITTNDDSGTDADVILNNGTTALILAASTIDGDLKLTSGHASGITDSGTVTVGGMLVATTNDNSGVINLDSLAVDAGIHLRTHGTGDATAVNDAGFGFGVGGSTVGGNLIATATTGNMWDYGSLTVGRTTTLTTSANNATITLNNTNAFAGAVTITTNDDSGTDADVTIDNGTTALILAASTIDGDLTLTSGHASGITDSGTVTVGGNLVATTNDNSGVINLRTLAVDGTVALTTNGSGNATVVNDAGLNLAASTVRGNLIATATTGNMEDAGVLTIAGTSSFTTSATDATITLNNANAFTGAVALNTTGSSGNATVVDASGLNLAASTVGGNLSATATTGNMEDAGVLTIAGTSSFTTSATDATITLNNANAFTGAVALNTTGSTGHATVVDASGLNLAASTVGGNLSATATTGDMEDSGVLTIAGTSSFTTSANNADITLNNANAFTGAVSLNTTGSSAHATVVDASGLNLAVSTVGGNLIATATTGNMEDAGVLTIAGTSSFTTSATDAEIILNNANVFNGAVSLNTTGSGGHASIDGGTTALDIAASSVGGQLHLRSGHASGITDSGTVTVGTWLSATTDDNNGVINLNQLAVSADIYFTTHGTGNATGVNASTFHFGANNSGMTVGGNLSVTSTTGDITDGWGNATHTVAGTTALTTSANNRTITLDNTNNAFTGAMTITTNDDSGTDADVILNNGTTALILAASTIDGDLTLTSGHASGITDSGTLTVGGNLAVTTNDNSGVINLGTLAVDGTVALNTNGSGNATVVNDAGLNLAASTVRGNLTATTTTGNMEDSGVLTIAGTSSFTTSATDATIILNNANAFTGTVGVNTTGSSGHATVVDASGLNLGASTVGGNLIATATTGDMEDSGVLTIAGTSSFTTSANNATITLNNANAFTGAVALNTTGSNGNATIDGGTTALIVAQSSVGGNLTLTSGHASGITDIGTVTVGGNLIATTDAANGVINLGTLAVDGTVALTTNGSGNATVVNDAGLTFAASTVGGNLAATATTGNMADSGALTITGTSTLSRRVLTMQRSLLIQQRMRSPVQ